MTEIPQGLLELPYQPSPCFIATTMPDGSPHLTQTWVDTDGEHIVINTVEGYRKLKNVELDPRVSVSITDPDDTSRYYSVRGRVTGITSDGGAEGIEKLAQKYSGAPYAWYGGRDQVRVVLTITVDKVIHAPW
ncbi:PPOX class F420-dependent oxidoreductase [Kribbella sp. NPDC056861]|uniref:PPOX class F420-dependent oxidoreductase n=1 Tax=Kribbella sp. NPDC056861 TaxID=3154857 RepID=UPI0034242AE9